MPEVAPLGTALYCGATDEDWVLFPGFNLPAILGILFHVVHLLIAFQIALLAIKTLTSVVSTTPTTCRNPTTSLCHTTLKLDWSSLKVLQIMAIILIYVYGRKCTRKWWCMPLLFLKLGSTWTTLMLTRLIPDLSFLVPVLLSVPHLFFFNLLHIDH